MSDETVLSFGNRAEWRRWLRVHHSRSAEAWLLFYKKHLAVSALSYEAAVEEAICWGWIDGKLRSIDTRTHKIRFTPRRSDSVWSEYNRRRAERAIEQGRMTAHGMAAVRAAKKSGQWAAAYSLRKAPKVPEDLKEALVRAGNAWDDFRALSNSQKVSYVFWVDSAKRDETRKKRILEVVKMTSSGKKL